MITRYVGLFTTALAAGITMLWYWSSRSKAESQHASIDVDAVASDPGLLKKHSTKKAYTVDGVTYPGIRTFYHSHSQADKLPTKPTSLPLLVFIHGLGGSVAQFNGILSTLANVGPCLAIDLPGCGLSDFEPQDWSAYSLKQLISLTQAAVEQHLDHENNQKIVLIGHSLGCSIATILASETSPFPSTIRQNIVGMIAICPRAKALSDGEIRQATIASYMPLALFDLLRMLDRRSGMESPSVHRFVGAKADKETKRSQLRFNEQSRSPVFLRFVSGFRPTSNSAITIPGPDIWSGINVPLACIAGEDDHTTPASNIDTIADALKRHRGSLADHKVERPPNTFDAGHVPTISEFDDTSSFAAPPFVFKTIVLPSPAAHGLMYTTSTTRIVSGLIQTFLASHVDCRLSIGWQLRFLTTEGKWDVKNLEKWQKVEPVSEPIAHVFRAMKTLREVDPYHTPKVFAKKWGVKMSVDNGIAMIVDVSHDSPVYDPKGLEEGGIEYHKFPTVSKLPPTTDEVRAFIGIIDGLRAQIDKRNKGKALIAVHCHYGFNRTGFFVIAYLIERLGYRLQDALDEFARRRPPGVRHDHFLNELHVRYAVGLKRAPTWH